MLEHTTVPSSISVDYPALTSVLACMHHMYRPHMYMYLVVHSRSGRTLDLGSIKAESISLIDTSSNKFLLRSQFQLAHRTD